MLLLRLYRRLYPGKKPGEGETSLRLLKKLREAGVDLPADAGVRRAYVGRHQRACGAWSWFVFSRLDPSFSLGSQYPIRELLRRGFVVSYEGRSIVLDPKDMARL